MGQNSMNMIKWAFKALAASFVFLLFGIATVYAATPTITGISPTSGVTGIFNVPGTIGVVLGTEITITGTNLGSGGYIDGNLAHVYIGPYAEASVSSWTDSKIVVNLPADYDPQSYPIMITTKNYQGELWEDPTGPMYVGPYLTVTPKTNPDIAKAADQKGTDAWGFFAYDQAFKGGMNSDVDAHYVVDSTDLNVVVAPKASGGPHVRVFRIRGGSPEPGVTVNWSTKEISSFFPFDKSFLGGVDISLGSKNPNIVAVSQQSKGEAWVKVYDNYSSNSRKILGQFLAYGRGVNVGANVALGDIDGDGTDEVITGPGVGGGPHLRAFELNGTPLPVNIMAFDKNFRGGLTVAAANMDWDSADEVIVAQAAKGEAWVKVYDFNTTTLKETVISQFRAFPQGEQYGATVNAYNGRILVSQGEGGSSKVKIFDPKGTLLTREFYAYGSTFRGGAEAHFVDHFKYCTSDNTGHGGCTKTSYAGNYTMLFTPGPSGGPHVRIGERMKNKDWKIDWRDPQLQ